MIPLVRGELARIRSTALLRWTMIIAVLAGGGVTGLLAVIDPQRSTPPLPGIDTPEGVAVVLGMQSMLVFVPALVGTVAVTSEYRHRTMATTLLAAPRRSRVLTAKLLVYAGLGLMYGVVTSVAAGAALLGAAAIRGSALGASTGEVIGYLLRLLVAATVYTVIGAAIGALARHQLLAVGIVLGYFYLLEPLLMIIPGVNAAYPYLPGGATAAIMDFGFLTEAIAEELPVVVPSVTALTGVGILLAYAVVAAVIAVALPLRRDLR